jgi:hypothetical protein
MASVAIAGCSGGNTDKLARVTVQGKVTIDGTPLDEGLITFVPSGFEGPPAGAPIKDGAYAIARQDGPIAGLHMVSVYSRMPTGKKTPDPEDRTVLIEERVETIPAKYNVKTELKADVKKEGENRFDFDLTGRIKASSARAGR